MKGGHLLSTWKGFEIYKRKANGEDDYMIYSGLPTYKWCKKVFHSKDECIQYLKDNGEKIPEGDIL